MTLRMPNTDILKCAQISTEQMLRFCSELYLLTELLNIPFVLYKPALLQSTGQVIQPKKPNTTAYKFFWKDFFQQFCFKSPKGKLCDRQKCTVFLASPNF